MIRPAVENTVKKKKTTTTPIGQLTPAAMFFLLAAIYVLPGGALLLLLDHSCFHGYSDNTKVFLDFSHARITILVALAVLMLAHLAYTYRIWRRKAERELHEHIAVSELLYHGGNDAIFLYPLVCKDGPAYFLTANAVACRRLGYTPEEFSTLTLEKITSPDAPAQSATLADELRSGTPISFETLHVAKDGRTIPVAVTLQLVAEKWHPLVLVIARELTERKAIAEESRKANETLHVLSDHCPMPIIGFDRDLVITRWNAAAEQLFGWSKADVLGHVLSSVLHSEVTAMTALYTRVLDGESLTGVKMRHPRKDGTIVDVSMWLAPTCDAAGAVNGLIGIIADLTERIRTDEELLRVNRALKVLSEAKRAIARATDESALLHDVCHLLINIGGYRFAWIGMPQPQDAQTITPLAYVGDGEWYLDVVNPCWRDLTAGEQSDSEGDPVRQSDAHQKPALLPRYLLLAG